MSGGVNWSAFEDDVIREMFPSAGAAACHRLLPDRTIAAIDQRASRLRRLDRGNTGTLPQQDDAAAHKFWQSVKVPAYYAGNLGWRIA